MSPDAECFTCTLSVAAGALHARDPLLPHSSSPCPSDPWTVLVSDATQDC